MKSFSLLMHNKAYLFSWFGGDSVMFNHKPGTDLWIVTCDSKQAFQTSSHPADVIQETFDFLTNKLDWTEYISVVIGKGN